MRLKKRMIVALCTMTLLAGNILFPLQTDNVAKAFTTSQTPNGSETVSSYDSEEVSIFTNQIGPQAVQSILDRYPCFSYLDGSYVGIGLKLYYDSSSSSVCGISMSASGTLENIKLGYSLSVNMYNIVWDDIQGIITNRTEVERNLIHEYFNLFMDESMTAGCLGHSLDFTEISKFPTWFIEGTAQVASGPGDWVEGPDKLNLNADSTDSDIKSRLAILADNTNTSNYGTGYLACAYLGYLANGGTGDVNADAIANGLDHMYRSLIYGKSLDTVINQWTNGKYTSTSDFTSNVKNDANVISFIRMLLQNSGDGLGGVITGNLADTDLLPDTALNNVSLFKINTLGSSVVNSYAGTGIEVMSGGGVDYSGIPVFTGYSEILLTPTITLPETIHNTYNGDNQSISGAEVTEGDEGEITYTYYADELATIPLTTSDGSGAKEMGGAPKNAGTYYVQAKVEAFGSYMMQASNVATYIIDNASQESPVGLLTTRASSGSASDGTITGVTNDMEFSTNRYGTYEVCTGSAISGLSSGDYYVRYAMRTNYNASEATKVTIGYDERPTITLPDNIRKVYNGNNQAAGTVSAPADDGGAITYSYYWDAAATLPLIAEDASGAIVLGGAPKNAGTYYVQATIEASGTYLQAMSNIATYIIEKASQAKPQGLNSENATTDSTSDGTIHSVTEDMEYSTSEVGTYTLCTGDSITGLKSGNYYVRYASTNNYNASETVMVTVGYQNQTQWAPIVGPISDETQNNPSESDTKQNEIVYPSFIDSIVSFTAGRNKVKLSWQTVNGAEGYIIYRSKANDKMERIAKVTDTTLTDKELSKGTYYKYKIISYRLENGKKVVLSKSPVFYVATTGGKFGNVDKIVIKGNTKLTIRKGKTKLIKAYCDIDLDKSVYFYTNGLLQYESTNTAVATVSSNGKITAKNQGSCSIYVYAQNGLYKKIRITVE